MAEKWWFDGCLHTKLDKENPCRNRFKPGLNRIENGIYRIDFSNQAVCISRISVVSSTPDDMATRHVVVLLEDSAKVYGFTKTALLGRSNIRVGR